MPYPHPTGDANTGTTVPPVAPVQMAARPTRKQTIGCLPIVSPGKLIDLMSKDDMLQMVEKLPN